MGKVLTQAQIDQFHQQGFVAPVDVFSEEQAAAYLQQLEAAEARYPQALNAENRNNPHLAFTFLDELAHHPVILDAVEDLIGADFSLWGSVLFIKEAQTGHYVSWHQDATYVGVEPYTYVTPWIALTPSNLENGCMSMLPGSHQSGIFEHQDTFAADNILTRGQQVSGLDESSRVDLILRAGQMSLHHCQIVHGSQPNRSQQRRVGYALQGYVPSGARQVLGKSLWMPIRGRSEHPDMIELQRPREDMSAAAVEQRNLANQNWADILYHGADQRRAY